MHFHVLPSLQIQKSKEENAALPGEEDKWETECFLAALRIHHSRQQDPAPPAKDQDVAKKSMIFSGLMLQQATI